MPKSMHFYVLSSGRRFIQTVRSLEISSSEGFCGIASGSGNIIGCIIGCCGSSLAHHHHHH